MRRLGLRTRPILFRLVLFNTDVLLNDYGIFFFFFNTDDLQPLIRLNLKP